MSPESPSIIVCTRPQAEAESFRTLADARNLSCVVLPLISIEYLGEQELDPTQLKAIIDGKIDWIVFTSAAGVDGLMPHLKGQSVPKSVKVAAVGKQTATRIRERLKREIDFIPNESNARTLGKEIPVSFHDTVMLITGSKNRQDLRKVLNRRVKDLFSLKVYENRARVPSEMELDQLSGFAPVELVFAFFSPSAVHAAAGVEEILKCLVQGARVAAIGAVTAKAVVAAGFQVHYLADEANSESLLDKICVK